MIHIEEEDDNNNEDEDSNTNDFPDVGDYDGEYEDESQFLDPYEGDQP